MYGQNLPNTGLATLTVLGVSFSGLWMGLALITIGAILIALVRMIPRKEL